MEANKIPIEALDIQNLKDERVIEEVDSEQYVDYRKLDKLIFPSNI